ncbi:hypothetical protein HPP92_025609 [Vanilla planifolia]|uniref:Uncharacterized protein n=1 Tax=Vanilla planifolia TaxID=51239 RepID=A0A835PKX7_VANPL|nr:hypothetical protein HPP92_025609 [Vanilla planifolia]
MADASSCPPPTEQCDLPEGPSTLSEERSSANEAIVPVPPPVDASIARPSATEVRRPPATHYSSDAIRNGPVPRIPNGCIRRPPLFGTGMPRGFIGDGSHMYDHVRHPNWHGPSPWGFNGWPSPMQVLPGVRPWPFFHPPIPPAPFMNAPCPAPFPPLAAPMRFPGVNSATLL